MIDRLAAPSALDAGSGATEGQGRRCDPDHNGDVSRHSPTLKVCHFQLPKVCRFQLPLTPEYAREHVAQDDSILKCHKLFVFRRVLLLTAL